MDNPTNQPFSHQEMKENFMKTILELVEQKQLFIEYIKKVSFVF